MKKQGFTLIELMVVIVIMGILAAVAVPKLFGMIAKSKASEVGPAAGEYVKLQDAYIAETGTKIGDWTAIGYSMNAETPSFKYDNATGVTYTNHSTDIPTADAKLLVITTKVGLNDCGIGSSWVLWAKQNGAGNGMNWGASIKKGSVSGSSTDMDGDCDVLTPQFKNLRSKADGTL